MKAIIGISVLVLAGVAAWAVWPKGTDVTTACAPAVAAIGTGAPEELAAMLDQTCAAALVAEKGPALAFDLGYPSLALATGDRDEVLAVIDATIGEGDRGFFAADPDLPAALPAGPTADFVSAAMDPAKALSQADDIAAVLRAIPIWGADSNLEIIARGCGDYDCTGDISECAGYVGLADKLAIAEGTTTLAEVQSACPISPGWILGLRRAGLVDTACTSTLAVNRAMADPASLGTACYPADFDASSLPGIASADYPRLLRAHGVADLSSGTLDAMQSAFPEAAAFLIATGDS